MSKVDEIISRYLLTYCHLKRKLYVFRDDLCDFYRNIMK